MLDRPDPATLLNALAGFLAQEVRPQVADKGLSFRLLIASGLLQTLALQDALLEPAQAAAAARLATLLAGFEPAGGPEGSPPPGAAADPPAPEAAAPTGDRLAALEAELIERLRTGDWATLATSALLDHLRQTARDELAIANPRFDPDAEVPL